jgi:predicted transcriptional regulator YdeE
MEGQIHMQIVHKGEMKLVGIKVVGRRSELSHRVPMAWLELVAKLGAVENKVGPELFYGVFPESDQLNDGVGGVYTYWVATEVSAFSAVPEGMDTMTIPAGRYALGTVEGAAQQIESAYVNLYGSIREQALPIHAEGYGFELYDAKRQAPTPPYERFDFDIYVPLA